MNASSFSTVNPATGEQIETYSFYTSAGVEVVLDAADMTFQSFRKVSAHKRATLLSNLAAALRKNKAPLAKVITNRDGEDHLRGRG